MVAESFTNFATTTLNGAISSPSATTFAVAGGQGALFPASNFVVSIDSEMLLVTSRATDTFTVGTRGFDNSTAATHSNGVSVQLAICAYNMKHLWQNVADTYVPQVPPAQVGGSASAYDNEFEAAGGWTLYPASGSTTFNAGSTLGSHLLLSRANPDNTTYYAYTAFAPGGATFFSVTCKLSQGNRTSMSSTDLAEASFFVSDQTNPTGGVDSGNRVRITTYCGIMTQSVLGVGTTTTLASSVRPVRATSGSGAFIGTSSSLAPGVPVWLRITFDGANTYSFYFSNDGIVYWNVGSVASVSFTVQSLGLAFHISNPSGQFVYQAVAVDYVRESTSSASYYGK